MSIPPPPQNPLTDALRSSLAQTMAEHMGVTPQTLQVVSELTEERAAQIAMGFTPEHDDAHRIGELVELAQQRMAYGAYPSPAAMRPDLVQAAAILVAAIESIDRRADA